MSYLDNNRLGSAQMKPAFSWTVFVGVAAVAGAAFFLVAVSARGKLLALEFPEGLSSLSGVVYAGMLQALWLPLLSIGFSKASGRGVYHALCGAVGAFVVGACVSVYYGTSVYALFWMQLLLLSVAVFIAGCVAVAGVFRLGVAAGRAFGSIVLLLLLSCPWWTQPLLSFLDGSAFSGAAHRVLTMLSPLALSTMPYDEIDMVKLPGMYVIMAGPVVPYPPGVYIAVAAYGLGAALLLGLSYAAAKVLRSDRNE